MQNAAEPHEARMLQPIQRPLHMQPVHMQQQPMPPLQMLPTQTQPVQYQEWQPHQPQPQSLVPYNPAAQAAPQQSQPAVQPVLWVPAQPQTPLQMPAR